MNRSVQKVEKQSAWKHYADPTKRKTIRFALHKKKRRLFILKTNLERLKEEHKNGKVSLCFGSKKLFNAQHNLDDNGFESHEQSRQVWYTKRSSEFFVTGSKDETGGCQGCVMRLQGDKKGTLRLRLPNRLVTEGTNFLTLPVELNYGACAIAHSLQAGVVINYRFKRDSKGLRVFITVDAPIVELVTNKARGSIGVDINANHIVCTETDRFGNYLHTLTIKLNTYGKTSNQTKAVVGDAVKQLMDFAKGKQKPIVIEQLDFEKKKSELEGSCNHKYQKLSARMLSSLAYNQIKGVIRARCLDNGLEVVKVDPAYTSVLGFWKFSTRYGLSGHQAAALAIARKAVDLSERPNRQDCNALLLPAMEGSEHVKSYWSRVARKTGYLRYCIR
ncbi:IS200/IS605 family accessory protein TnpB-related protein [Vibrio maritimus]|uniref:IS200/IS605 family accessory protein TnpB-related protein n=1 Tax=Vibrio maritimus TaxID=990268 RepID=UPI00373699EE